MWTWNSLGATQTESGTGAPSYGRGWYGLLIVLLICLQPLKVQADTYPATREYKAWIGSGVAVGYESPVQPDFQSAGRFAWDAWQLPSYLPPGITKIDWFADSNCQNKAEPAFISQSAWVEIWVTYGLAGISSCSWSYNYVFINLVCPYGGHVVVDQCYNAPPCQAPLTRDLKTGACIQSCQSPDVIDPATGQCVKCPISDLPPITDPEVQAFEDNPDLSDTARLTNEMQAALQRLLAAASAAGGNPTVGSAYRPPAYNQHLIDVWDKYMEFLRSADNPKVTSNVSCMLVLWPKIQRHFQKHGLLVTQSPVPNSRHTRGLAVDVTINLPSANIDALAASAGLRRPLPVTDRVHFQFP